MNKQDIKEIVNDEINKFVSDSLDKEVKKIMHKNNSATRDELVLTIKKSMEGIFKVLWQKRDFWATDLH
jgi:hypothetical protein